MSKSKKNNNRNKKESKPNSAKNILDVSESIIPDITSTEVLQEFQEKITALTDTNRLLKRKIFDLYTIFEINRNFNAVLDYQQLLDTFIFTSLAQVSASKAAIFLEKNHKEEVFTLTKHRGSGDFPKETAPLKADSKMLKYLLKINRPSRTEELFENLAGRTEKGILKKFMPGLIIPLVYQTKLIGLFLISDKVSNRAFGDDDIEFMSILGNQISVAIENTRLYEAEKLASQQLRSAQEQLVHSERLAALGEMSAKVAHEINNPLGIIKNYLLLTDQSLEDNKQAKEYTNIVSQEIDRIAQIVRELLDFHRPKGFAIKSVDVAKIVSNILHLAERQLEISNIKVVRKFDPNCPSVNASPENMKQVFLNLVINAIDVMEGGGQLEVDVFSRDDKVHVKFSDSGPGIPPELIPRIFEPFFTTKDPLKGHGLGLSICYGIIKKHKGTITYKNLDPGGSFEIILPVAKKDIK